MYPYNSNSVIKRSRAERKKLGIKRAVTLKAAVTPSPPVVATELETDIIDEILQDSPKAKPLITEKTATDCPSGNRGVEGKPGEKQGTQKDEIVKSETPELDKYVDSFKDEPKKKTIKKKSIKKKAAKKPDKKKATSRGTNVKVAELDQEELSDLFSGPTATVDDDDDE